MQYNTVIDNLIFTIDDTSSTKSNSVYVISDGLTVWESTVASFIDFFPLEYGKFYTSNNEAFEGTISFTYHGSIKKDGDMVFRYILDKYNLKIQKVRPKDKAVFQIESIKSDIVEPDQNRPIFSKNLDSLYHFQNLELSKLAKILEKSSDKVRFKIDDKELLKLKINVKVEHEILQSSNESILNYFNKIGLETTLSQQELEVITSK